MIKVNHTNEAQFHFPQKKKQPNFTSTYVITYKAVLSSNKSNFVLFQFQYGDHILIVTSKEYDGTSHILKKSRHECTRIGWQ